MKTKPRIRVIDLMIVLAIAAYVGYKVANRPHRTPEAKSAFAAEVVLNPLHQVAVQADGRIRSFESHAKTYMNYVSGPRTIDEQSYGFTYLDLIFRSHRYHEKDIIYVKNKNVRARILEALADHPGLADMRKSRMLKTGLFPPTLLRTPAVTGLLQDLGRDLIRTSKDVDRIQSGLAVASPDVLAQNLRVVAPPSRNSREPWISIADIAGPAGAPVDSVHAGLRAAGPIPGFPEQMRQQIADAWGKLQQAWRTEEAPAVNESLALLSGLLRTASEDVYPSPGRLAMESWYFRNKSMTWVWWFYALSLAPLLMSVIYHWDWARRLGLGMFVLAFFGHTASLGIRWYISGRWPNSNMFEAVHTSAWLGGVAALALEWWTRRTLFRNLFVLGSAAASMAALMAAYFMPAQLDTTINNKMAALNDVWLYIHTNMIILAYALIALAAVTALLLLRHRWCLAWDNGTIPRFRLLLLPVALAVLNYTGYLLLMHVIDHANQGLASQTLAGVLGAFAGSVLIFLFEGLAARERTAAGLLAERSAAGGAASVILGSPQGGHPFLKSQPPTAGQVFDGATMVLLELSFITLWAGIVMGAIWADHSWGRPWGWDPKEVFALNTFFIFLILIHVRMKVRDKAFWTAVLAVIGFEVMMFNWIVVNFIISGLHSYA